MKKIVSIMLCIILAATTLFSIDIAAFAAESGTCGTNGDNLTWTLANDGTLTISKGSSGEARMIDFVNNGNPRPGWYESRTSIKKVVMGTDVVNIGAYAFDGCSNLTEVDFGSIDTIGNHAFLNCTSLPRVDLPSSFNWMYSAVFEGCTSLKYAYLGERWWTDGIVPDYFFNNCTSLSVVRLGSKFTGFGTGVFNGCTNMKGIISDNSSLSYSGITVYPTSVLGGKCSDNTNSNIKLTFALNTDTFALTFTGSGDMSSTPWSPFMDLIKTISFSGTNGKVSISTSAFSNYSALTSVDFTNVYSVGWGAFGNDTKLGSISFGNRLTDIWGWAFSGCTSISTIEFTEGSGDLHIREHAFDGCTGTTFWIDLPANTKYIDEKAFYNTNFNYNKIYSADVQIGDDAFGDGNGGYARFFSVAGTHTTTYDYVLNNKKKTRTKKSYDWHYFCLGDNTHQYATVTVAPTCTEKGYDRYGCLYCEQDEYKSDYVDALGHDYELYQRSGENYLLSCKRCGRNDFEISAIEPMFYFADALSTADIDNAYNQNAYDARVDVNNDGFINGKDWAYITQNIDEIDTTNKATTIDKNTKYQTIEGWGASAAWWAQEAGEWENIEDIVRLLYSKDDGIGLNIFRYNLGAGSRDINDTTMYNDGARTNCFLKSDGTYDWNNDPGAMNTLELANSFCPNVKVELFSNSAPVYMTNNGKAYQTPVADGEDVVCNLSSSNFTNFANFVANCAEHFLDEGYNVTEVSPINEPEWGWTGWYNGDGSISCGQEGCHFEPTDARDFYNNAMVPVLKNRSKLNGKVELAVWECAQLNHGWWWKNDNNGGFLRNLFSSEKQTTDWLGRTSGTEYASYNSNIRSYTNTLDTHSYWASTSDREAIMSDISGSNFSAISKIKCSEYCQMTNDYSSGVIGHIQAEGATNGMTIDYGLAMADIIYQDMTILNAVEWDWWTACSKGIYTDALVYIDSRDHSNIQTAKRLWCLGNYSKFIQEGAQRIKVETGSSFGANLHTNDENLYEWDDGYGHTGYDKNTYIEETAYLNPDGTVAIVYINNSDSIEYTSLSSSGYSNFETYVTDNDKDLVLYQSGETSQAVCVPARSCTTVVLSN
ncbi:MAG: leucine-rich repeat protein [Eubacterium sp.]|nr:leucine-rich repeat protein [Eubacterium sp.]